MRCSGYRACGLECERDRTEAEANYIIVDVRYHVLREHCCGCGYCSGYCYC